MIGMGDHPRVCGEHLRLSDLRRINPGSSPRVRGTRAVRAACGRAGGIIPAYAGNTSGYPYRRWRSWDHPRVCGEHQWQVHDNPMPLGSSPRMRGTLKRVHRHRHATRIIPAYAGNTTARNASTKAKRDHPRVCGEHKRCRFVFNRKAGSSPRMRGTRPPPRRRPCCAGIIPAYTGNTDSFPPRHARRGDHPRVCGEHLRRGWILAA